MKKLIMCALVAIASIASQAAWVEWSLDRNQVNDAKYNTVYCFLVSDSAAVNTLLTSSSSAADFETNLKKTSLNYTQKTGSSRGAANGNITTSGNTAGISESVYLVLMDTSALKGNGTEGTGAGANYYVMGSANGTTSTAETPGTPAQFTSTQATGTWKAFSTSGGVPEPTSGLLLVLGGAMLALRRKR